MQIKKLAKIADEKWAAKPSLLDRPQTQPPTPATRTSDQTLHATKPLDSRTQTQDQKEDQGKPKTRNIPSGPGETWQPESWTPDAARR